jgi:hypothetical protein
MPLFSERHGHVQPKKIAFINELPLKLRYPIFDLLQRYFPTAFLKERVQAILDPYGIDSLPRHSGPLSISKEHDNPDLIALKRVLLGCEWFQVYDILEDTFAQLRFYEEELAPLDEEPRASRLQKAINDYFVHAGIGWKMVDGKITTRQDEAAETAIQAAISELDQGGRPTAAKHIQSALHALSERPKPNTSGAVAHATNSVECVLGDVTGKALTLGKYLDQYPKIFHPALKKTLDGIYGFASDAGARHGKEGVEPSLDEAQFAVTTCAAACAFLNAAHPRARQ